jgi:cysteine sulfinate desulfinase/cysteine desulfurase-like protein
MEQQKAFKPQVLEALVETIKADYRNLMVVHNVSWRTPQEREEARLTLARSVRDANAAVQSTEGTTDPVLRRLHDALLIQVTLSEDAVKNPGTLKR